MKQITINIIDKTYHNKQTTVKALTNVRLTLPIIGLTIIHGPSGSGKSTLLNIISGQDRNFNGTISGNGKGYYLRQQIDLIPFMRVVDNLRLVNDDTELIDAYLKQYDVYHCRNKLIRHCSSGQQRRIQFIKALLVRPCYLLLDEITAALDHDHAKAMMEIIHQLSQQIPIIMVTHDQALVSAYADRIIRLEGGMILSDQIINTTVPLVKPTKHEPIHKMGYFKASGLLIKARPSFTMALIILITLLLCCISLIRSVIGTTNTQYQQKEAYRSGSNIIISQPINQVSYRQVQPLQMYRGTLGINKEYPYFYIDYDLFDIQTIDEFIQMHPTIYAVDTYYDGHYNFNPCNNQSMCSSTDILDDYKSNIQSNASFWFNQAFDWIDNIKSEIDYTINGPFILDIDVNQIQQNNWSYSKKYDLSTEQDGDDIIRPLEQRIHLYTLVNDYESSLPLSSGRYPQTNDELVLDIQTAQWLCELYGYTDVNALMAQPLTISISTIGNQYSVIDQCSIDIDSPICYDSNHEYMGNPVAYSVDYTIVGISEYGNDYQYIGYTGGTIYDNHLYSINVVNPEALKFHYMHLMVEPSSDPTNIINDLYTTFNPTYDQFILQSELNITDQTDQSFTSANHYRWLSIVGLIGLVLTIVVILGFDHKNQKILRQVFDSCGYHYKKIIWLNNVVISLISMALSVTIYIWSYHFILHSIPSISSLFTFLMVIVCILTGISLYQFKLSASK